MFSFNVDHLSMGERGLRDESMSTSNHSYAIGCGKEEVNVYDSLYPSINDNTETIIACLLFTRSANIKKCYSYDIY